MTTGVGRIGIVAAIGLAAIGLAGPAKSAETKIVVSCTATSDCSSAFVAAEQGFFKAHGIDVSVIPIGLNSNIPAAMMSGSVQFGGPTLPVFLQAVDGGLDLVAVAGASIIAPSTADGAAIVARTGEKLTDAKDFIGKKVGVPGIGAFLDVLFRQWLIQHGVDPKQVTFVEVTFPTMNDILKGGSVDAVIAADPFMARILSSGTGYIVSKYLRELPEGEAIILYAATRDWANAHSDAVRAFRAAITEGAAFANANPGPTREAVAKYTRLPIAVLKGLPLSREDAGITKAQLDWWVQVMQKQNMLQSTPDTAKLLLP